MNHLTQAPCGDTTLTWVIELKRSAVDSTKHICALHIYDDAGATLVRWMILIPARGPEM